MLAIKGSVLHSQKQRIGKVRGPYHIFLIIPDSIETFPILRNAYVAHPISKGRSKIFFCFHGLISPGNSQKKEAFYVPELRFNNTSTPENVGTNYNNRIFMEYISVLILRVNRLRFCVKVELYFFLSVNTNLCTLKFGEY